MSRHGPAFIPSVRGLTCLLLPLVTCQCAQALNEVVPAIAAKKNAKGGYLVLRPDSGDPTEAVLMALVAADKVRTR
jgi:nicotinic acid phosphoribosyltransferase